MDYLNRWIDSVTCTGYDPPPMFPNSKWSWLDHNTGYYTLRVCSYSRQVSSRCSLFRLSIWIGHCDWVFEREIVGDGNFYLNNSFPMDV